jgi:hypothetical protein
VAHPISQMRVAAAASSERKAAAMPEERMMRLRSMPLPVLCDAIEQLFTACPVANVVAAVREGLIGSGDSPDANLHQDLVSLELLVMAHATANLAKIREKVLRTDSTGRLVASAEALGTYNEHL